MAVAATICALEVVWDVGLFAYVRWVKGGAFGYSYYFMSSWWESAGPAVLAGWITVRLAGDLRPADWADRLGQAIGAAWVALVVAGRVADVIW